MTPDQFIKLCVYLDHDPESIIAELAEWPFNIPEHEARPQVLTAIRNRQETRIADQFDDILHTHD